MACCDAWCGRGLPAQGLPSDHLALLVDLDWAEDSDGAADPDAPADSDEPSNADKRAADSGERAEDSDERADPELLGGAAARG